MPDYLFLYKQPNKINTKELIESFKNGSYDIANEENQLHKLSHLLHMGDFSKANSLIKEIGLYQVQQNKLAKD